MTKNYSIIKTMIVLMILVAGKIGAQCNNSAAFGTATAPAPGGTVQVTTCMFAGEYGTINSVVAGNTYSTTSSVAGDYITIRSGTSNGPVVAFGVTPLTWVATTAGTHFAHVNTNYACGTLNSCHTVAVGCYPAGIANDFCANAISILPVGTYSGTTVGSTVETPAVPACVTSAPTQSGVWYTVIGNGNRLGLNTTCGSAWDSKIWVFTGGCGAFTCVTGNDDNGPGCSGVAASVSWCSQAGVEYRILVAGFSSASNFVLNATQTVIATPTITASQNLICSGKTATLTGTGNATYTFNPGSIAAATATVAPVTTTQYTLTGTNNGCPSPAAFITLTVNASPAVTVNSGAICSSNSFTMAPTGGVTYTYSSGSAIVSPTANATYTVTGSAANGCTNSAVSSVTVNATPTISVNSGAICSGSSFTMNPSGASTYTFSNGSAIVTPASNASYSVTGTSTAGCVSSAPAVSNVTVNALPVISVNSGAICSGKSFTMIPSGASTYTYSNGSAVATPTANASYSVTGTSTAGCVSSVAAVSNVTVNALPVVSVNSGAICAGNSFTMVPSGASTYTYSNGSAVATPTANASYSVTGTSTAGCVSSAAAVSNVTVNANPVITAASGAICNNGTYTIMPNGANTYTISGGSAVVSPSATTSYSVTGTSLEGCSGNTAVVTVSVQSSLTVSIAGSNTVCDGQAVNLTANGAATYTWNNGATSNTIAPTPTVNTTYSVTGASGSCSNTAVISVTVNSTPTVSAVSNTSLICAGQTISLTANGAVTYTWSTNATGANVTDSPTITTTYIVTGEGANGCTDTASVVQSVSPCTDVQTLNNSISQIEMYPNPTTGMVTVKLTSNAQIIILNTVGQVISNEKMTEGNNQVDISKFANGIYFVQVLQNGQQKTFKLIKE